MAATCSPMTTSRRAEDEHRRALVVQTRMPAFDRDSGSQDIDNAIRFLLDAGWS